MTDLAAPMTGDGIRLEPMAETHRAALKAACAEDPDIWEIYSTNFGPDGFDAGFDKIMGLPWARFVIFGEDGELVGMSSFLSIHQSRGVLEIGCTYYRPKYRGTGINRRVKDLMMSRAFACGYRRIEFRVDARNQRSQAAMTKLGAVREGINRADRITWTGHVRDAVLFSILNDEWPPQARHPRESGDPALHKESGFPRSRE